MESTYEKIKDTLLNDKQISREVSRQLVWDNKPSKNKSITVEQYSELDKLWESKVKPEDDPKGPLNPA